MEKRRETAERLELHGALSHFLDPAYSYKFMQNPDVVRSKEDAIRYGINCISLAHLAIKELFDYELPSNLLCAELYRDQEHFIPVESLDDMRMGDLAWFGVQNPIKTPEDIELRYDSKGALINWREFPVKHVAISTGLRQHDDPLLLHATHRGGGRNTIWPLSKFDTYKKYQKLYRIARLAIADYHAPLLD